MSCLPLLTYDRTLTVIIHVKVCKHAIQHKTNISSILSDTFFQFLTRGNRQSHGCQNAQNKSWKAIHMAYINKIHACKH